MNDRGICKSRKGVAWGDVDECAILTTHTIERVIDDVVPYAKKIGYEFLCIFCEDHIIFLT
jgi:hypothetical protein